MTMTAVAVESVEQAAPPVERVGGHAMRELALVGVGAVLLAGGFAVHRYGGAGMEWLRLVLIAGAAVCTSVATFPNAVGALRAGKLDVDLLMFLAAGGAAILGRYEEGGLLLLLFGLGTAGEHAALARARGAIDALSHIAPETARRFSAGGAIEVVPVARLTPGDRIEIRPFDRIPADSVVEGGESSADESALTGESLPVPKAPGAEVLAGSVNGEGLLTARVARPAGESVLARVIELVEKAQAAKSTTQQFTDRVGVVYVPAVLVIALGVAVGPPVLGGGEWHTWFYRSMAVLTAASPCALAIGTPAAMLCAVARAARSGILIKGGAALEALAAVRAVAMDKTGTLTTGRPVVTQVVALAGTEQAVLAAAAAVEAVSTHPLAAAVVAEARRRQIAVEPATDVRERAGHGVEGTVGGRRIAAGRPREGDLPPAIAALRAGGMAVVMVEADGTPIGAIALADEPRPSSAGAVARLRTLGVTRVVMLTGDHAAAADSVATKTGVDEVRAGLMPGDKLALLKELAARYGPVAMVGDGVNDAPALAGASVGIAMAGSGGAGAVAMETADVVLMGGDLGRLPEAIALAHRAGRIVRQNLVIALGVIAVVAPLAALGHATLWQAVLLHEGSTIVVVLNGLRLLRRGPAVS